MAVEDISAYHTKHLDIQLQKNLFCQWLMAFSSISHSSQQPDPSLICGAICRFCPTRVSCRIWSNVCPPCSQYRLGWLCLYSVLHLCPLSSFLWVGQADFASVTWSVGNPQCLCRSSSITTSRHERAEQGVASLRGNSSSFISLSPPLFPLETGWHLQRDGLSPQEPQLFLGGTLKGVERRQGGLKVEKWGLRIATKQRRKGRIKRASRVLGSRKDIVINHSKNLRQWNRFTSRYFLIIFSSHFCKNSQMLNILFFIDFLTCRVCKSTRCFRLAVKDWAACGWMCGWVFLFASQTKSQIGSWLSERSSIS